MKNLTKNMKWEYQTQVAFQLFDRKVMSKKQLLEVMGVYFENNKIVRKNKKNNNTLMSGADIIQVLIQLYDREIITKDSLLENTFGLEVAEEIKNEESNSEHN